MKLNIDTSSFDLLLEIISKLKEDKEITKEVWEKLLSSTGYQELTKSEFPKEFFVKNFGLAFNPKLRSELEDSLENSKHSRFLQHYSEIYTNLDLYQRTVKDIQSEWSRMEDAIITRTQSLLPFKEFDIEMTVAITVFDKDARAYGAIVLDPSFLLQTEAFVSLIAHEAHHIARRSLIKYDKTLIDKEEQDIVWALEQIHSEGIADHIDKGLFIFGKEQKYFHEEYIKQFKFHVQNVKSIIEDINEIFLNLSNEKSSKEVLGKLLCEKIPLSGHPLGYYMANLIIKNSLLEEMLRTIGNPFNFFKIYNKAVEKDREEIPAFSHVSINQLELLEQKYIDK